MSFDELKVEGEFALIFSDLLLMSLAETKESELYSQQRFSTEVSLSVT